MMRTNTKRWPGLRQWPLALCASALIAACGGGGGGGSTASGSGASAAVKLAAGSTVVPQSYSVRNLPPGFLIDANQLVLNDNGQVCGAYRAPSASKFGAALYDGNTIKSLSNPNDPNSSFAAAINSKGWVVGNSIDDSGASSIFFYDGTTRFELGALGAPSATALFLNEQGQIAGSRNLSSVAGDIFLYSGGTPTTINPLSLLRADPTGLNAQGQIAGYGTDQNGFTHAFVYAGGVTTSIGPTGPGTSSQANAINDMGQVAGDFSDGTVTHAFRYEDGILKDLGALDSPANNSYGTVINAAGKVAGYSYTNSGVRHAFVHDGTTMRDLGTLGGAYSAASAINAGGMVVGQSATINNVFHAFVWSPDSSTMIDLNDRIDRSLGIVLDAATAISSSGLILAHANTGWVLLKPVPDSVSPPTLGPIVANDPVAVGSPVNASVQFTDADAADTHTASWTWDASGATAASVTEPSGTTPGSTSSSHVFTTAGVYNVTVTITDSGGRSSSVGSQVVVYDPNGGFVAGGGWIVSPPGAYKADPNMAGRANFGFTSKYLKGATTPSGQTEFQFQSANLNFHSDSYDWLVVGGARAQYKGTGTINGSGSYKFMLTAVDGDLIGKGTPDRFRIRIWHHDDATNTDIVDYDNQLDSSTVGSNLEGTAIGGGSISIKTK